MADDRARINEEIAKLRQSYRDGLPRLFAELGELAAKLESGNSDRSVLEDIHQRLHKLAGSGGTFGQARLSESASRLEQTAKNWLSNGIAGADSAAKKEFSAGVAALSASLADATVEARTEQLIAKPGLDDGAAVHVWLVDDDEALGRELSHHLGQFGYQVRHFTSVAAVETAGATESPDVLVLDVMFPGEGVNATEAMLDSPTLRGLGCPLLFVSAHGDFESRVRAARAGAAGFLRKPLDVPRLVDRIERIFDDRQAAPYRVMIIDDDAPLAEHFRLVLAGSGMEVEILSRPETMIERIAAFQPELVLMDMHMPDYSGPELATVIRQHDEWIGMPIVYLSAETDLDEQIKALGRGADDFLTKPISDARLAAAVRVRVSRSRQLADLMAKDSLTGLLKHSRIKEEIDAELSRARRNDKPMSVVMVDIDHFKRINDTYGHAVGDRVIKTVANLLRQRLRKTDVVGRYGGEEFAIALPDCDAGTAREIMDDFRRRFAGLSFYHGDAEFGCTLSAGIACSAISANSSGNDLLVAADEALYCAKNAGRNQVSMAVTTK